MGTRTNYYVSESIHDKSSQVAAILFSNDSHPEYDAIGRFKLLAKLSIGPTDLVKRLLDEKYPVLDNCRLSGQPVFSLDSQPYDNESVLLAYWEDSDSRSETGKVLELPAFSMPLQRPAIGSQILMHSWSFISSTNNEELWNKGDLATLTRHEGASGWWAKFKNGEEWNVGSGFDFIAISAPVRTANLKG